MSELEQLLSEKKLELESKGERLEEKIKAMRKARKEFLDEADNLRDCIDKLEGESSEIRRQIGVATLALRTFSEE
jgi:chromosome segregation ATPase